MKLATNVKVTGPIAGARRYSCHSVNETTAPAAARHKNATPTSTWNVFRACRTKPDNIKSLSSPMSDSRGL